MDFTISLCIPFYDTSKYFLDCINYSIDNEFVGEIIVNDDYSSEEEYSNLLQIINKIKTDKIKVYRNIENVGAFRNKYIAVQKCTNNWVYLLDSDNYPFQNTYNVLKSIVNLDPNICYSPAKLYCKHDGQNNYVKISDYNAFNYEIIGIEESKNAISRSIKWFDWFINSGNYFFNRDTYLKNLKEPFDNFSLYPLYADTAAAFYFWLKEGGKFKVVENLCHNHRLRPDSYWNTCGNNSQSTVDLYSKMILDL